MFDLKTYLNEIEGDANGVIREDYTHYTNARGSNVTKMKSPENTSSAIEIVTERKSSNRIAGQMFQRGAYPCHSPAYNTWLDGKLTDIKIYWNAKKQGERPIPSWISRALEDHLKYFYKPA